jgi:hypothetical protein
MSDDDRRRLEQARTLLMVGPGRAWLGGCRCDIGLLLRVERQSNEHGRAATG